MGITIEKKITRIDIAKKYKNYLANVRKALENAPKKKLPAWMEHVDENIHRILNMYFSKLQFREVCALHEELLVHLPQLSERTLNQIVDGYLYCVIYEKSDTQMLCYNKCIAMIETRFEQECLIDEKQATYALQRNLMVMVAIADHCAPLQSIILLYVCRMFKDTLLPMLSTYPVDYVRISTVLYTFATICKQQSIEMFDVIEKFLPMLILGENMKSEMVKIQKVYLKP